MYNLGDMPPVHSLVEGYFTHEEEISWLMFLVLSEYGKMQGTGFIESLLKVSEGQFCQFSQSTKYLILTFSMTSFQGGL